VLLLARAVLFAVLSLLVFSAGGRWPLGRPLTFRTSPARELFKSSPGSRLAIYVDSNDHAASFAPSTISRRMSPGHRLHSGIASDEKALGTSAILVAPSGKASSSTGLVERGKSPTPPRSQASGSPSHPGCPHPLPGLASGLDYRAERQARNHLRKSTTSRQDRVSPWYWWADFRSRTRTALFVKPGKYVEGELRRQSIGGIF